MRVDRQTKESNAFKYAFRPNSLKKEDNLQYHI